MKFASEFRDPAAARALLAAIAAKAGEIGATRQEPIHIMEICGGIRIRSSATGSTS